MFESKSILELCKYNLRHLRKNRYSQSFINHELRFLCLNPNLSWNYVNKIFSYLSFDRDEFLPFTFDQIKEIIITFKDSELIVLQLTTLYDMIFAQKKEHPRAR